MVAKHGRLVPYATAVALASLTHFYGLFLMLAAGAWDGWRRRWGLSVAAAVGALPALAWMVYAAENLFSSKAGSWIGGPSFALLEDTLAQGLGVWPLPKLALLFADDCHPASLGWSKASAMVRC